MRPAAQLVTLARSEARVPGVKYRQRRPDRSAQPRVHSRSAKATWPPRTPPLDSGLAGGWVIGLTVSIMRNALVNSTSNLLRISRATSTFHSTPHPSSASFALVAVRPVEKPRLRRRAREG